MFFKVRENSNFGQGVAKPPRTPREIWQKYFLIYDRPGKLPRNFFCFALWKIIVSQTRETPAKCFLEKIIVSQTRETPAKCFLEKIIVSQTRKPPAKYFLEKIIVSQTREPPSKSDKNIF